MATPTHTLNLCGVLSESKRIINAHSRHFLALSVLFLLPLSFSLIIYPTLQATLSKPDSIFHHPHAIFFFLSSSPPPPLKSNPPPPQQSVLLAVLFSVFVVFLSLCAVATITYSTIHGFYGRPVKIVSSLKSLLLSFLRLCSTFVVSQVLMALVCFVVGVFVALIWEGFDVLGFEIDYMSKYVMWGGGFVGCLVAMFLLWLQVNWALGLVVVVVESKWGYEPLRRSAYLINGMKCVALSIMLLFGVLVCFFIWGCSTSVANAVDGVSGWKSWAFIFQTVVSSGFVTILMLHSVAANAVLYMYSKALHGELAFEIVEEFAREYVSLPFDDAKVPHVVSVVQG